MDAGEFLLLFCCFLYESGRFLTVKEPEPFFFFKERRPSCEGGGTLSVHTHVFTLGQMLKSGGRWKYRLDGTCNFLSEIKYNVRNSTRVPRAGGSGSACFFILDCSQQTPMCANCTAKGPDGGSF